MSTTSPQQVTSSSFLKKVNSGTSYSGTTVFLDADIDFSGLSWQFEPIGSHIVTTNLSKEHLMDRDTQSATLQ